MLINVYFYGILHYRQAQKNNKNVVTTYRSDGAFNKKLKH
jgi:hypothetical protein